MIKMSLRMGTDSRGNGHMGIWNTEPGKKHLDSKKKERYPKGKAREVGGILVMS